MALRTYRIGDQVDGSAPAHQTYYSIAAWLTGMGQRTTVDDLRRWNPGVDERALQPGQVLNVADPQQSPPEPEPQPEPPAPVDYGPQITALTEAQQKLTERVAKLEQRPTPPDYGARIAELERRIGLLEQPAPPEPPTPSLRFRGDPGPGRIVLGSSAYHNGPVTVFERDAPLPIRRRFFDPDDWGPNGPAIAAVREDKAAGRMSWISSKFELADWADVVAGRHDDMIDAFLRALDAVGVPVAWTVHHEAENDPGASPALYRALQEHIRSRMTAVGTRNILLIGVFMTWSFDPRAKRNMAEWTPKKGTWDCYGGDHYTPDPADSWDTLKWRNFVAAAREYGAAIAIGEFAFQDFDPDRPDKLVSFVDELIRLGVAFACYFHSTANSKDNQWPLTGVSLATYLQLLVDKRVARLPELV